MRRVWLLSAALLASTLRASPQTREGAQPLQLPTFRGGTNLIQVDAIVADANGQRIVNLIATDFELLSRDAHGRDPRHRAAARIRPTTASHRSRRGVLPPGLGDRRELQPRSRTGAQGDPRVLRTPRRLHAEASGRRRAPPASARDRTDSAPDRDVVARGAGDHLGGIKQERKTIVFVSEGFTQPVDELRDLYEAANRANVAIDPLDPTGLTTEPDRGTSAAQMMKMLAADRDAMRALALETGGRAIVQRNDIRAALDQVLRDASASYLIAYESPHPDDGKCHRVTVRVKRPRALCSRAPDIGRSGGARTP